MKIMITNNNMKKINCRAKVLGAEKDAQWIYGSLVESEAGNYIYSDIKNNDGISELVQFRINIHTVGVNVPKTSLYIGDVLEIEYKVFRGEKLDNIKTKVVVYYDTNSNSFSLKEVEDYDGGKIFDLADYKTNYKLIGNIIDGYEK